MLKQKLLWQVNGQLVVKKFTISWYAANLYTLSIIYFEYLIGILYMSSKFIFQFFMVL